MAKAKPTKGRKPASKATATPSGPDVTEGIESARALNESIAESGASTAPEGIVTWPTRYGNPDMSIPPATPTRIEDGVAVPVTDVSQAPEGAAPEADDRSSADDDEAA